MSVTATIGIIMKAVQLGIKYGPAAADVVSTWQKETITEDDIDALEGAIKDPHAELEKARAEKEGGE